MDLSYYNIAENPFDMSREKRSLWFGGSLPKVSLALKEAIMEGNGIVCLTGDAGTGKSTLIKMLMDILQEHFIIASLSNPELTGLDFFNALSTRLKFDKSFNSKSAFLVHLRNFLHKSESDSKKILLIFLEADRLKIEIFEELALLLEIGDDNKKMISSLLVGREGWIEELLQKNAKRISDHITLTFHLDPLTEAETAEYIQYCLGTAGTKRKIFSDKAIREIFSFARGNLNLINSICDLALKRGYAYKKKTIHTAVIKECGNELQKKGTVDSDVKSPQKFVFQKKKKKELTVDQLPSPKRWLWIKVLFVLLFIFSSYILYKSQTEKISEIAHKDYDFQNLNEEEIISSDAVQGTSQKYSESDTEKRTAARDSSEIESNDPESLSAGKITGSDRLPTFGREWPFSTYKKIIYFQYDSNSLSPESLEILDKIAEFAVQNPDEEFVIKGYTDSIGADSYNLTISKFRANSVKNYLIAKGADPTKLETFGLGSQNPIFSNRTAGGRKLNRRVEIELKLD